MRLGTVSVPASTWPAFRRLSIALDPEEVHALIGWHVGAGP